MDFRHLGMTSYENVLKVVRLAKRELAEILSSCELMDKESLEAMTENLGLRSPLSGETHNFYVLIETAGSKQIHDEEKLSWFVEKALSEGLIEDGTMTGEPAKIKVRIDDVCITSKKSRILSSRFNPNDLPSELK